MTTAVIVQARLSSSRLPGKVMQDVAGQPLLGHVLDRCLAIPGVDVVVCATVSGTEGDPIETCSAGKGVLTYRGPRDDVLERYRGASRSVGAEVVMRVTSDCPLIDPRLCGRVLRLREETSADFACNNEPPSFPHGLDCETFVVDWLERAADEALQPAEREHVTPYMRTHPDIHRVGVGAPLAAAHHRWTVDYPEDLEFVRRIMERLPEGPSGYDWLVPLGIAESDPSLVEINARHHTSSGRE